MVNLNRKNRLELPFIANSKRIFDLPLGGKVLRGAVIVTGTVTVSAGTVNGTVQAEGGPVNLVQHIYVNATPAGGSRYPGGKIVDCSPRSLLRFAPTQRNGKFFADQGASTLGAGAVGTYPVYMSYPIYWQDSTQKRADLSTTLNTDPGTYASVQVEVDTGSLAACFTGNDRVADFSALTVQWVDYRAAIAGDTMALYQEDHSLLIAATAKRLLDPAMPQDGAFLSWQILGEQGAVAGLSDALLNRLVVSGPTIDFDLYDQDIRQVDFDEEWYDPSMVATGMYYVDFTDGAIQASTLPAGQLQTYFDVNNVSGANADDLLIFTRRIFAPTPAPSSGK